MKHTIKKYLTILLLLGLSCKVTACSNDKPFDETEIPPHLKPGEGEKPDVDYYPKNEGTTRLVSYNVGIFSKYTDSYQMVADMMTEAKARHRGYQRTRQLHGTHDARLPAQEVRRTDGTGLELQFLPRHGPSGRRLWRRHRLPRETHPDILRCAAEGATAPNRA